MDELKKCYKINLYNVDLNKIYDEQENRYYKNVISIISDGFYVYNITKATKDKKTYYAYLGETV